MAWQVECQKKALSELQTLSADHSLSWPHKSLDFTLDIVHMFIYGGPTSLDLFLSEMSEALAAANM